MKNKHLDFVPVKSDRVSWCCNESGSVTLKVKNRGICNCICQKIFSSPKTSRIALDNIGSYVWLLIDGRRTVLEIGSEIDNNIGMDAYPVYERLIKYMGVLKDNKMIKLRKSQTK